jgi:16S rRNA A1518/A1519 N6-dimethyltransferase RsmA/KsgA/DIM1 with predicted DNA glycosylase/AP lyase activity
VRLVHAVELDRGLEPHLRERLTGYDNVELVMGGRWRTASSPPRGPRATARSRYSSS